jgi:hypothetical protein
MGVGRQCHTLAALPLTDPVPTVQETGLALGPVWVGKENLAPTWVQTLDPPAHNESLYQEAMPAVIIKSG